MMQSLNKSLILLAQADGESSGGFLRWLLGLERIDPAGGDAVLGWRYELPLWVWVLIVLAVAAAAALTYRHMLGARTGRAALAAVRAAILLAVAVLLAGPMLVLPRENVEPDHVLMLLDRSASMSVRDVNAPSTPRNPDARQSREEQLRGLIEAHQPVWDRLSEEHRVDWLGFSDRLTPMGTPDPSNQEGWDEPDGRMTALRSGLQQAIARAAGRPISAAVVWSDGRSSESIGPETWQLLQQSGAAVWVVPLGSPDAPPDLALQRIDAPDRAFVDDTVPITVTVGRTGGAENPRDASPQQDPAAGEPAPPDTAVQLVDEATGETLDRKPIERFDQPIRLMTTPETAGQATWRVELTTAEPDLIEENNRRTLELDLVDRPIRLLYVEGPPRWEYRYLKNLLIREESVHSSMMLTSADRDFAQEGDEPLRRLPRTEEEIEPYDVIIIGDVPADYFSGDELRLIEEQVSDRGAGLMWIAGPRHTPDSYTTSPLASLLPISGASSSSLLPDPIILTPAPAAEMLGVLRLRSRTDPEGEADLWPEDLPTLMWAQSVESLKPAAEVLAIDERSTQPLVVRMRFGAGQTLFVATDEIWRWRYGRGELYGEQFWMQIIRLLARGRLQSGTDADNRARLAVSQRRAATGDTLVVELAVTDQSLLESISGTDRMDVEITGPADRTETITLSPADRQGWYRGTWSPRVAGEMSLHLATPSLADLGLEQTVHIQQPDAELRYPATDHALLAELAERTGGGVLSPDDLTQLDQTLPNRERRTAADISEPLSHSPLAFILLAALLTTEWIGRRTLGLA